MDIELRDVWYRYGRSVEWALQGVSIVFRGGEVTHITGHNGSGKTTLLKIASLIYRPIRGLILVNGEEFWMLEEGKKTEIRRRAVYVHEKPILLKGTALDNVMYGLLIRGVDRERAREKSLDILSLLNIEGLANTPIQKLSTGQAQLVAIARALAVEPKTLFLDEPFAHLDREKRDVLIDVLKRFRLRGLGIVISSHTTDVVELGRHRRIVLERGAIASISEVD